MILLGIVSAFASGISAGSQAIFNALLQQHIGIFGLICWVHFIGFVFSIPLVLFFEPQFFKNIVHVGQAGLPLYVLLSGGLGLIIVPGIAFSIGKVNPALAFSTMIIGQLFISMIIQHFGLFGVVKESISFMKVIASSMVIGGIGLFFLK